MDWDSIGMFALFMSGGGITLGVLAYNAYLQTLEARNDRERMKLEAAGSPELQAEVELLADRVDKLTERLDFTERLLSSGAPRGEVRQPDGADRGDGGSAPGA